MLKKYSKHPFGLDISDNSLRLIQLKKSGQKIFIQTLSKYNLPNGIIDNGVIIDKEKLTNSIVQLIAKPIYGTVTTDEVVACLPETKTFIKLINIEKNLNNLNDLIEHEIEKYVPIPIVDIYFDWQIIREDSNNYEVLIGAAPKNIVNSYQDVMNNANLFVNSFEIEPISICRCLLKEELSTEQKTSNNYAIIDIGKRRTSFIIYSKNSIVMSISMPISGDEVTLEISKILKINEKKAEKAKIVCGLDEMKAKGVIKKILSNILDNLNNKISNAINFYNDYYPNHGKISEIIITGGGSNINGIDKIIEEYHSIPVKFSNNFLNLSYTNEDFSKELKKSNQNEGMLFANNNYSSYYTTAIGLALKNIIEKN